MEPNNLCSSLIVYGSYAPGRKNHHVFADLPGEWKLGKIVATADYATWWDCLLGRSSDHIGPGERDVIKAWTIKFSDCTAEIFTPEWDDNEKLLYNRWQELDRRIGKGWGRGSMRWWPANSDPAPGENGMIVVNVYLPLENFPYLTSVEEPLKPFRQEILDIWVGYFAPGRLGEYYEEHYNDDDDVPLSEFVGDQGEFFIDHDFMEVGFKESPQSISELVEGHSWCDQYREELTRRVSSEGIQRFNSFVFLTAGEVESPRSVTKDGVELHYMGQFTIPT